jgi:hypothetical protein
MAKALKARPVRSVPVIVEEKGRSVVPFSAFILGIDRECQVEDNAFSRKRASRDGIFLSAKIQKMQIQLPRVRCVTAVEH